MFNIVSAHLDYFQDIYYQKPSWILFLLMKKFVGERNFPIQNSYTSQVQCTSLSRDKKFVTSLVQSQCQSIQESRKQQMPKPKAARK